MFREASEHATVRHVASNPEVEAKTQLTICYSYFHCTTCLYEEFLGTVLKCHLGGPLDIWKGSKQSDIQARSDAVDRHRS